MTLHFHKEVLGDISTSAVWYERRSPGLGRRFREAVYRLADQIVANPMLYQVAYRQFRRALIRPFPHVIYYATEGDSVTIYAVWHAMRDPKELLGTLDDRDSLEQPSDPS